MPEIKRSVPVNGRPLPKPIAKVGSLLDDAIDFEDIPDAPLHMLLYGRNGVGKTTLACKFPKPLLLLSCEFSKTGGAQSVKKIEGGKTIPLQTVEDVKFRGKQLQSDTFFKSVVFDSGTALDEIVLAHICGWDKPAEMLKFGQVSQDQYRERSEQMRNLLSPIISLDKHVVIIANEKDHNPPESRKSAMVKARDITDESFFGAAMGGGTARWCQDACDWICQLYVDKEIRTTSRVVGEGKMKKTVTTHAETGRIVRRLRLRYHPNFSSRIRSPDGESMESVPDYLEEPTFADIERVLKGT